MSRIIRVRCPICGFLGCQSRLDKEWDFEVLVQQIESRGRGRIRNTYYEPESQEGVFMIKIALADKLEEVAQRLRDEADSEKDEAMMEALRDGGLDRAVGVSNAAREAGFDTVRGKISLTGRAVEFVVVAGSGKVALVDERVEPARAAYQYEDEDEGYYEPEDSYEDEEYSEASDYLVETEDSEVRQPGLSGLRFFNLGGAVQHGSGQTLEGEDEESISGSSGVESE